MASASSGFKQELPPPEGFGKVHYDRIKPQKLFRNWTLVSFTLGMFIYGHYYYKHRLRYYGKMQVERLDHFIAIEPLIWAERDRNFLKQLRFNREEEEKLMKDVPGWVLGTIWGQPVFHTVDKNDLPPVSGVEYYTHQHPEKRLEYYWADSWL